MSEDTLSEFVVFFKALADESRLKVVGILAQKEVTGEELAAMLQLHPGTISHHVSRLVHAGLVTVRTEGYYRFYRLNTAALQASVKRLLSSQDLESAVTHLDIDAYDKKVLGDFLTSTGRLKNIPAQRKKRSVVLRYITTHLKPGHDYTEKQLNAILERFDSDVAYLRREMIAEKLIVREKGTYRFKSEG